MEAQNTDPSDQLDDFIHSYSCSDEEEWTHPFDEDASYSDSASEPPEDASAEAEDMALYDLYDNSAVASPQPPGSPMLAADELETVLDTLCLDPASAKIRHDGRKRPPARARPFSPAALKHGEGVLVVVEEDSTESGIDSSDDEEESRLR
ncbi:hypothetical protein C8F01DRAFT_1228029 [Mycena amicta]|nr:hypothetical protein C8F01DRAFT_1228029 [Mycena amicta]